MGVGVGLGLGLGLDDHPHHRPAHVPICAPRRQQFILSLVGSHQRLQFDLRVGLGLALGLGLPLTLGLGFRVRVQCLVFPTLGFPGPMVRLAELRSELCYDAFFRKILGLGLGFELGV